MFFIFRKKKMASYRTGSVVTDPRVIEPTDTLDTLKQLTHSAYVCNRHDFCVRNYRSRKPRDGMGKNARDWIYGFKWAWALGKNGNL
ncbi:MAG: hypothetical protein GTO24_28055 [candidate division Zixibacteria bacterium]|nr:hypothetical protein [candidate division Zixibacteria bacterium]